MSWLTGASVVVMFGGKAYQLTKANSPIEIAYVPLSIPGQELAKIVGATARPDYLDALTAKWKAEGLTVNLLGS
jgi:hypothetical protein